MVTRRDIKKCLASSIKASITNFKYLKRFKNVYTIIKISITKLGAKFFLVKKDKQVKEVNLKQY